MIRKKKLNNFEITITGVVMKPPKPKIVIFLLNTNNNDILVKILKIYLYLFLEFIISLCTLLFSIWHK